MKNILRKSLFILAACLLASGVYAQGPTPIANLNFEITSTTTAVPDNYVYSSANTPNIKTQNSIKCIIVSDGGASTAPTFNGSAAPSGGKRWMAFCPAVDCSVTIGIMSNRKKFFIQNKDGEFYTYTNTANQVEEQKVTGLKAGEWYAMCGGSSQVYITKMTFEASGAPTASTDATLKSIVYGSDETPLPGFASDKLDYNLVLPKGYVGMPPTVKGTPNDTKATVSYTLATTLSETSYIDVTAEDGQTKLRYSVAFTVASGDPVAVTGVSLNKSTITLEEGQSETLTATIAPADATDQGLSWTSNNTAVATVANGIVTAVSEGTATITVKTNDGNFTAQCTVTVTKSSTPPTPSGSTYAFWRFSGSDAPVAGTSESGTKMTVEFFTTDPAKTFSTESAAYNQAVTDDNMKSQGAKGIKMGGNALYLKVTVDGGFKKDDVVSICGYNSWKVSSTDGHSGDIAASVATGTSKTDYNIGSFTLNADANALYMMRAEGSGTCICAIKVVRNGGSTPSTPVAVESVSLDKSTLTIEAGQTAQLTATISPANADNKNISWSSDNNTVATVDGTGLVSALAAGTATITVTTEDGNKTATCAVTVTAPAAPIEVESISIKSATTISIGGSETLTVTYTPADANTGKAITWTSNNEAVATVDANGKVTGVAAGTATITATSEKGKTATCTVTVEAVSVNGVSLNKSTLSLEEGKSETLTATVLPANATNKNVSWSSSNTTVATVNANGAVTAVKAGTATITVTTEDGSKTATCAVTVKEVSPVPQTDLDIHYPEVYEEKAIAGGYGTPLTVVDGHEYEVYYTERTSEGDYPTFSTILVTDGKTNGISGSTSKTENVGRDGDKWFQGTIYSHSECKSASATDEFDFGAKMIREHRLGASNKYQFHVQGFDQFALWGMDKKLDPKNGNQVFVVKVDGVEQPTDESLYNTSAYTVRRYNLTAGRHLIEISTTCTGSNVCYMGGFSLRVAQQPRTKRLKGNDSTQTVKATTAIKPITYFTKYNSLGETRLVWNGPEVAGLTLTTIAQSEIGDTLSLSGMANCPAGEYKFAVAAYFNGIETSRVDGKFNVVNHIEALTTADIEADQDIEMDDIKFRYYVYDTATDLHFTWKDDKSAPGITTSAENGTFKISGTPTTVGTYCYSISVTDGDTISGCITVNSSDLGVNPIMFLYKNSYKDNGIYQYLTQSGRNLKGRQAKDDLRSPDQYNKYKWILISEDVDADNPEVLRIIHGGTNLPVLNMKAFSYAHPTDSLSQDNWGEADNGSISENGKYITVERDDHPIFKALNKKRGDKIQILDSIDKRGLMPIAIKKANKSLCLASALTRDIEDYYGDGKAETFMHEIPSELSGRAKYISLPIAKSSSSFLTQDGKNLLNKVIDYLLSSDKSVASYEPEITSFAVNGITATQDKVNSFKLEIDTLQYPDFDLTAVVPDIQLASPYSHTEPAIGDTVDLSVARYIPFKYVVTDFITRREYEISVRLYKPQGIEEVYTAGEWVNVYDIFGRKIATTNENIYTMTLPRGIYIVVTESGQTLKITK